MGDKQTTIPSYTPPSTHNLFGYVGTSNNYRVYIKGISGSSIFYTVTATTDATVKVLVFPILKAK